MEFFPLVLFCLSDTQCLFAASKAVNANDSEMEELASHLESIHSILEPIQKARQRGLRRVPPDLGVRIDELHK